MLLQQTFEESEMKKEDEDEDGDAADQLQQMIHTFCQGAIVEKTGDNPDDQLYMSYADIMARYLLLPCTIILLLVSFLKCKKMVAFKSTGLAVKRRRREETKTKSRLRFKNRRLKR